MVTARVLSAVGIMTIVGGIAAVAAQTPASPAFEVVSIKPAPPGSPAGSYRPMPGGRLTGTFSLHNLIGLAYHSANAAPRLAQIVGEPSWAASVFSITATVGADGPTELAAFSK